MWDDLDDDDDDGDDEEGKFSLADAMIRLAPWQTVATFINLLRILLTIIHSALLTNLAIATRHI